MCCSLLLTHGNGGDARVARGDRRLLLLCHLPDLCCDVVYAVAADTIITGIEYQVSQVKMNLYSCILVWSGAWIRVIHASCAVCSESQSWRSISVDQGCLSPGSVVKIIVIYLVLLTTTKNYSFIREIKA